MSSILEPAILHNSHLSKQPLEAWNPPSEVLHFHRQLPDYSLTPLVSLPIVAKQLGLGSVYVKDESLRLGLPAFKILGASWAVHRAMCKSLSLATDISVPKLAVIIKAMASADAKRKVFRLVTSTDGNWGRGVARMGKYLGIEVMVYVPLTMDERTQEVIRGEGSKVIIVQGDYDLSVKEAEKASKTAEGDVEALLVQDVGWEGYEEVPTWVVEGYSTMMRELDEQLAKQLGLEASIDLAIASVGVGSFAQAVTLHFKARDGRDEGAFKTKVVAVEPTKAACLRRSLQEGKITSIATEDTIMCGMNCGTVSTTSWAVLRDGLDAAVVVTDREAHEALLTMQREHISTGPCGAAPLAALRKICGQVGFGLGPQSNVVLFCTEGMRPYEIPE